MQRMDMIDQPKKYVQLGKRTIYLCGFLFIAVPVIVGSLVWYFTDVKCTNSKKDNAGDSSAIKDDDRTTTTTTTTTAKTTIAQPSLDDAPWMNLRLPEHIQAVHYDITLFPDFYNNSGWFYGNETVELNITRPTKHVLIHFNYLNITNTTLVDKNQERIPVNRTFAYAANQFWIVEAMNIIQPGTVFLKLQFDGSLTRAIVGFYKSTYINSKTNEIRNLATSKFQPTDARRAFPCLDEPNFKAQYTIRMVHLPEYIALSNMPNESTEMYRWNPRMVVTNFQRSPKMSTYLACFIVCDFASLENTTKYGTKIRVFATPDRIMQAQYSLGVMKTTMEYYQELFDVAFPLPKNDMIAIPDFVSGAMEHWGLITYREVNMLYDETGASAANKQRVAVVVAHEVAHMWFGNIVTMDWWDDLWLNEGFASFVEYIGVNVHEQAWQMMDQFVVEDVQPVMITDAGVRSHPIVVPVSHPDQINEVFDAISYSKGASVIRMSQEMLGREKFFQGIGRYLKKHEWGTAKTDDLWAELGNVNAGYSVKTVMDTWTRQMGLPVISITRLGNVVYAKQQRFLLDKSMQFDPAESPFRYKWYVCLDYITSGGSGGIQWMPMTDREDGFLLQTSLDQSTSWIKFNVNQTGFYRVNYPDDLWQRFGHILLNSGPSVMAPVDRSGLLDDAFNLARGGYLNYTIAMELTRYLHIEDHHLPWDSAYHGFDYLSDMFELDAAYIHLRNYVLKKVKPVMDKLTWADHGDHLTKLMRSNIITLACGFGDNGCLANATKLFRDWLDLNTTVPPNLRDYVYKYGLQNAGTEADWDKMWAKYMVETIPQERIKLLYGLANTKEIWLLNRYLKYTKDETKVRSQDFFSVITYIASNPVGRSLVWDWVRYNWEYLINRFSLSSRSLGRLIPSILSNFNTDFKLQEVNEFFAKYPEAGSGERARQQALESIHGNIRWMNNYKNVIVDWLKLSL
ncbi:hypothetical protein CHS0354_031968 [Potamilus streckersoni]|uniref:Aminopeptidase n=1 Tax=Potamilus streckersoni TaxID=2493646 RepID=A0AAE0WHJ5_9BIVA|nr:hypothetical protein CHS0354_031968 [Potamilus streckersoni]